MTVPPIQPPTPAAPSPIRREERFSRWKARRSLLLESQASAGGAAAKELAKFALAELTNPASLALADLGTGAAAPAQDQGGDPAALALAQLRAPSLTALTGVDAPGTLSLTEAIDAASVLASAQAGPDALAADPAAAFQSAVTAKAISVAAGVLSAATVALAAAPQDPGVLAADSSAKYLGAGFLGPAGVPDPVPPVQEGPDIAKVSAASPSAPQTYSDPHDLAFGQTAAAHLEALPAEPGPAADQGLDLTI